MIEIDRSNTVEYLLLDLKWRGSVNVEVMSDGTYRINGEVETRPEVITKALSEVAIAWGNSIKKQVRDTPKTESDIFVGKHTMLQVR